MRRSSNQVCARVPDCDRSRLFLQHGFIIRPHHRGNRIARAQGCDHRRFLGGNALCRGKHPLDIRSANEHDTGCVRNHIVAIADVLIADADVFVQNLKPGAATRLGFDSNLLCSRFPKLICCSISGFHESGSLSQRKAYDLLIQAESGLASITGGPDEPSRVGISIVDIATGATAHAAILEALIARTFSGCGCDIRISMFDVIAEWMTVPLLNHEAGASPKRLGLAHPSISPYGVFCTNDGASILISIQNEREWAALCEHLVGNRMVAGDPRFVTNVTRVANRLETDSVIASAFSSIDRDEAIARLERADVAYAEVNDLQGLSRHSELRRIQVDTPHGEVAMPAPAARIMSAERRYGSVPSVGGATKKPVA